MPANYPSSLDTALTVYDDGSSITDTARVVATGGALGANYGFMLGTGPAGAGVRNIPRGGFPQGPAAATGGTFAGAAAATGGQMATGTYRYQVTLQTQFGESAPYTISGDVAVTGPTGSVYLSGLPLAGPTATVANPVIARKIYRTTVASGVGGSKFLVGIIDDALATAYLDMLSDAEVGTQVVPATDSSGVSSVVVPSGLVSGNAVTFTEVALSAATPSASLSPASIAGPYTCTFAVDYSYGATGGTIYFPSNFNGQTVTVIYVGGTVPTASLINTLSTEILALETNAVNLNAPAQQAGTINVSGIMSTGGGLPAPGTATAQFGAKRWYLAQTIGDNVSCGQFDYRGDDPTAVSIVGAGTSSTNRKITLWDLVTVVGGLTVQAGGIAVTGNSTITGTLTAGGARVNGGRTGPTLIPLVSSYNVAASPPGVWTNLPFEAYSFTTSQPGSTVLVTITIPINRNGGTPISADLKFDLIFTAIPAGSSLPIMGELGPQFGMSRTSSATSYVAEGTMCFVADKAGTYTLQVRYVTTNSSTGTFTYNELLSFAGISTSHGTILFVEVPS